MLGIDIVIGMLKIHVRLLTVFALLLLLFLSYSLLLLYSERDFWKKQLKAKDGNSNRTHVDVDVHVWVSG